MAGNLNSSLSYLITTTVHCCESKLRHLLAPNTGGTLDFTYAAATVYWVKIELAPKISISSQKLTYRKPDQQSQAS